jgi:hypothetical protein
VAGLRKAFRLLHAKEDSNRHFGPVPNPSHLRCEEGIIRSKETYGEMLVIVYKSSVR